MPTESRTARIAAACLPGPGDLRLAAVCERLGVRMLVLFGSCAPGGLAPTAQSDVDLAFLPRDDAPPVRLLDLDGELAALFGGRSIDLASLRGADPLFRWEVMDRAVLLYGDIDDFLAFRAYAYRDFVDSADLRALEQALCEKKLARIGERLRAAS
jgi:predicted nucleotidyltransferase